MFQQFRLRITTLFKEPAYRTKVVFFILIGTIFILLAIVSSGTLQNILVELAVTFSAVGLVQMLWDFLGGDPIEEQISQLRGRVLTEFDEVHTSLQVLNDLHRHHLGIVRFWPTRTEFVDDRETGSVPFRRRVVNSSKIDMVGITLWTDWFRHQEFRESLLRAVEHGAEVRILVYEPRSQAQRMQERQEYDLGGQMIAEICQTVKIVQRLQDLIASQQYRGTIQIKLTHNFHHTAQIVANEYEMIVAFYLAGSDGTAAPTIHVRGNDTKFHTVYRKQIETLWNNSRPLNESEITLQLISNTTAVYGGNDNDD